MELTFREKEVLYLLEAVMALPDSGMSMVLAVDVGVFRRRAEGPLKTAPAFGCMGDLQVGALAISDVRMRLASTSLEAEGERVFLSLGIILRARLVSSPVEIKGKCLIALDARPAAPNNRSVELVLTYEKFAIEQGVLTPEQESELDDSIRAIVNPLLGSVMEPIPLGGILPEGASLVWPALLKMPSTSGLVGSTLLIGLEVDTDTNVNRNRFRNDFAVDLLAGGTADWRLEIDSGLVRQRAADTLASSNLVAMENWITTGTEVLWSGDPITVPTHNQAGYILQHYQEHPLWFVIEGIYNIGLGVWLEGYAVGHADLILDADSGLVMADPFIFRAGLSFVVLEIEDQPEPLPVMNTTVGEALTIDDLGFDARRLRVFGLDEHHGMPGDPHLITVPELLVNFKPSAPNGLCKMSPGQGKMRPDGTVVASSGLGNIGDAPLWICQLELSGEDPAFKVRGEAANPDNDIELSLPAMVEPGDALRFTVLMQVADGDHAEHQSNLVVRSNDFQHPLVTIPIRGRKHPPAGLGNISPLDDEHRRLLCLGEPKLIPPPVRSEGIFALVRNIDDLVNQRLPKDALVDLTMTGVNVNDGIIVRGQRGEPVGLTSVVGAVHQLTVPLDNPGHLQFEQVGGRDGRLGNVMFALGRLESVLDYEGPSKPSAAVTGGGVVFAAFDDGVHLVPFGRGRASAILPLPAVGEMDASAGWLFVRSEMGIDLIDVGDPSVPKAVKTIGMAREGVFRALPRHLLIMEENSVRVYGLAPGALPVWQGEASAPSAVSLVTPWQRGVAILGKNGGMIAASLEVKDLARAEHIRHEALPSMLRLLWETRLDARTSLPSAWQQPQLVRLDQRGVRVLERRSDKLSFRGDKVATFLREHGIGF